MLFNKSENKNNLVKFVSYTGKYPNLCSGVLTLEIDGKQYKFGHNFMNNHYDDVKKKWVQTDEDENNPNFDSFWHSGGSCYFTKDYQDIVETNEWNINVEELPEKFKELAEEIDIVFNDNVPWGCCGGCL
ncbi:MAG: hypothetical protein IKO56_08075 [Alphaproteobacteria bacterium]|nr:hypothetical protein [Alphaproteobacteria bacterium]